MRNRIDNIIREAGYCGLTTPMEDEGKRRFRYYACMKIVLHDGPHEDGGTHFEWEAEMTEEELAVPIKVLGRMTDPRARESVAECGERPSPTGQMVMDHVFAEGETTCQCGEKVLPEGAVPMPGLTDLMAHHGIKDKVAYYVEPTKQRPGDQVLPSGDESLVDDQQLVIDDIEKRRQVGIERVPIRNKDGEVVVEALIDSEDAERVLARSWHRLPSGYIQHTWREGGAKKHVYLHRFVMNARPGDPQVDHENLIRHDCRKTNLRWATNAQNAQNRADAGGASRHRGVAWDEARGKWMASGTLDGQRHFLGRFDDEDDAGAVAAAWRAEHMDFSAEAGVIADVTERREVGISRYGQGHRPFNGRDTLEDVYEEQLDLLVYLRSIKRMAEATEQDVIAAISVELRAAGFQEIVVAALAIQIHKRLQGWIAANIMKENRD